MLDTQRLQCIFNLMNPKDSTIIVADAHIRGGTVGKSAEFFKMLDHLKKLRYDIVFLGDVFELWIALDGYEDEHHKRFLQWCAEAKTKRSVGFLEGNHEYFVSRKRSGAFTWATEDEMLTEGGILFDHGDLINIHDWQYRLMRRLFKSLAARAVLNLLKPIGPAVANRIRVALKGTNKKHRKGVPGELLEPYAARHSANGAKKIFVGHFHEKGRFVSKDGVELNIVPSWRDAGLVGVLAKDSGKIEYRPWHEVW